LAPSTDTDPPTAAIWTIDNVSPINDTTVTIDEWVSGPAPTFIGTTSFSLVGDQTTVFHVGRRLKTTNTGGTIYSVITVSAFTTLTTITVVNDSGVLDSGLSAVSYGLLSEVNPSLNHVTLSTAQTVSGAKTNSGVHTFTKAAWTAEGANIASAADCDIWGGGDGGTVHVTGTIQINDWGTASQAGAWMRVIFDDALLLNYNATTNDLETSADITTVANDSCIVYARSTSSYQIFNYQRKTGIPLKSGWILLDSQTVSTATEIDLTTGLDSTYDLYVIILQKIDVSTDDTRIELHTSTDGGSTFDDAVSNANYLWTGAANNSNPSSSVTGLNGQDYIPISHDAALWHVGNGGNEYLQATIWIHRPSAVDVLYVEFTSTYRSSAANAPIVHNAGSGLHNVAENVDAIRISPNGGTFNGTARLYGVTI
jgi:hypothetical protein